MKSLQIKTLYGFCALQVLVQVIEESDGNIIYPSSHPICKLHWVKLALDLLQQSLFDQLFRNLHNQ